jgi:threonine dehydrogenase-like Zn-dependent dehydrogenase
LPAGTAIFPVPGEIPNAVAATANCAGATVAATMRRAGPLGGARVLVAGAGMLGITACAMAADAGAREVIVVDRDRGRAERAMGFGATRAEEPAWERLSGVDVAFDFCGEPEAIEGALGTLRPGGQLVLAGAVYPARALAISAEDVTRRMLQISGVYNYSPLDLWTAIEYLAGAVARYPFAELIGGRFPLERIDEAIEFMQVARPFRVAITPE